MITSSTKMISTYGQEECVPFYYFLSIFIFFFYLFVVYAADASLQVGQTGQQRSDGI